MGVAAASSLAAVILAERGFSLVCWGGTGSAAFGVCCRELGEGLVEAP